MKKKILIAGTLLACGLTMHSQITQTGATQTGFNTPLPANKVHITTAAGDPYHGTPNGSSGLRLTNLDNTKLPFVGNGKVLSVDVNGDVILVNDNAGTGTFGGAQNGLSVTGGNLVEFGNAWGLTTANLLSNREVPQNNFSLLFSGNQLNDRIKIGGSFGSSTSNSRVYIENHKPLNQVLTQFSGLHITSDADVLTENIGGLIQVSDKSTSAFAPVNKGISVYTSGTGSQYGAFISSLANANSTSPQCYGIHLTATSQNATTEPNGLWVASGANGSPNAYGVLARTTGASTTNHGGVFVADGNNSSFPNATNIGVVGIAESLAANGTGMYSTAGPSNGPVQPNSIHKGLDIVVSTASNITPIQGLTQYGIKSDVRNLGIVNGASVDGKLYGVYSRAWNESKSAGGTFMNFGIYATAETARQIDGAANTESNIAVYGTTRQLNFGPQSSGLNSWAGFFDGDVYIDGSGGVGGGSGYSGEVLVINGSALSIGGVWTPSDQNLKNNITKLSNVSEKLSKLSGYTYMYNTDERIHYPKTEQIGLLAQELSETFPQLVQKNRKGDLSINYVGMIPVLLQGFKEQQTQLEAQQQEIKDLKSMVNTLIEKSENESKMNDANQGSVNGSTSKTINLTDKNVIVLNQNVPNPFAESTTITYNIPGNFTKAQLIFSTNDGKTINVVDITERGAGSFTIFANDLSNGMYSYSLVVDEKVIDSKRMIKE